MDRKEKIALQEKNKEIALAFKEGFFYKVFNEGAYLLQEKQYKVQSSGKGIGQCLYVGFTEAVMEKLKLDYKIEKNLDYYSIQSTIPFDNEKYRVWHQKERSKIEKLNTKSFEKEVLNEIVQYPLSIKAPIEVFTWIATIQDKINKYNKN